MFRIPKDKLNFLMLMFFVYISAPILEWFSLLTDLDNGEFPVGRDSVGLPLGIFILVWLLSLPLVVGFAIWILLKYPLHASLFAFNSKRPVWTVTWSLIFALPFFYNLILIIVSITESNFAATIQDLVFIYLILIMRASVVFRNKEMVVSTKFKT